MKQRGDIIAFGVRKETREIDFSLTSTDIACTAITIACGNNKSLTLDYSDGKMFVECDADMNEAAETFFNLILKPLVDNYIADKLR